MSSEEIYATEITGYFSKDEHEILVVATLEDRAPDGWWSIGFETDLCPAEWVDSFEDLTTGLCITSEAAARRRVTQCLNRIRMVAGDG